jgi:hypothetical protein
MAKTTRAERDAKAQKGIVCRGEIIWTGNLLANQFTTSRRPKPPINSPPTSANSGGLPQRGKDAASKVPFDYLDLFLR